MKRILTLLMTLCVLLSGCSYWMNGSYSSVEPHKEPAKQEEKPAVSVSGYEELLSAVASVVESGAESGMISVQYGNENTVQNHMDQAIREVRQNNPFAAYAVENIEYTFGASGSRKAVSVRVTYLQNRVRTDTIQRVQTLEEVQSIIAKQLDDCAAGVVLYFEESVQPDYVQMVMDYALEYPQQVMEIPEVTVRFYPEQGRQKIVELNFTYQTSRAQLRTLQNKVAPVFSSALQYVTGDWTQNEKAMRLYAFLMGRYEYSIQTSITPAYSLLLHGVGDHRAFAMVYGAMCRQAGLDCYMVTGTRNGTPWVWNAVRLDGVYYYIDLLRDSQADFRLFTREEMVDYVWDYSAYPIAEEIL